MPNKNKKTAIYFYAREYAEKNQCSIKDAITDTYLEWKSLTPLEREPYETMLVRWKEDQKKEKENYSENKNTETVIKLEDMYHGSDHVLSGERKVALDEFKTKAKTLNLKDQKWYFIKFQTYCKTEEAIEDQCVYLLAEVALVEYSLEKGITNEYHEFIKPESVPYGYRSVCMDKIKNYHQIPLDFAQASSDYADIYKSILKFVQPREENNYYTPIFCMNDDYNEVRYGLRWLYGKNESKSAMRLDNKIVDLQTLVMTLGTVQQKFEMSFNSANELLTSFHFDYTLGIRCDYHEDLGILYCALGYVRRYAYLMSDQLCPIHKVEPVPGKHLPIERNDFMVTKKMMFSSDYREPTKLLKDSYKESSSNLGRDNMDSRSVASTSFGRNMSDYSAQQSAAAASSRSKAKVSERLFQNSNNFDDSSVTSGGGGGGGTVAASSQKKSMFDDIVSEPFDMDEYEGAHSDDEDNEDNWTPVNPHHKSAVSSQKPSMFNYGRPGSSGRGMRTRNYGGE